MCFHKKAVCAFIKADGMFQNDSLGDVRNVLSGESHEDGAIVDSGSNRSSDEGGYLFLVCGRRRNERLKKINYKSNTMVYLLVT